MFDILPSDALPPVAELPDDLANAKAASIEIFRKLPAGPERNSVLSTLGRLGHLSLPKKVAHRISIIESKLEARFPDLQLLTNVALKCRNFFVHGSTTDFEYSVIERFMPLLTDTLEFIFSASDLIEAGWDAENWNSNDSGWRHTFGRFRETYDAEIADFRRAIGRNDIESAPGS
jgi:hypothetical protein